MKQYLFIFTLFFTLTLNALAGDCSQGIFYIDPSVAATGDGTSVKPLKTWPTTLKAGACYLQKAGTTFTGHIMIASAPGTAALPIIMGGYGTGANPVIKGTIDLQNSSNVLVVGFTIQDSVYPGIVIEKNSKNISVLQNSISNCKGGMNLTNGALGGHLITKNIIFNNVAGSADFPPFGIGIYKIGNTADSPTVISENYVYGNGSSGIELVGNYNYVVKNTVYSNGVNTPGSSGIHVYAGNKENPLPQFGNNNLIMLNITIANREIAMQDGNGIQLDQYASRNVVYQNLSMLNDGPGISIYDSNDNYIAENQLLGNAGDPSKSHLYRAELFIGEEMGVDLSKGNIFFGNQFLALRSGQVAVLLDKGAATNTRKNIFSGNYLYHLAGGNLYSWAETLGNQPSAWNAYIKTQGGSADIFTGLPLKPAASVSAPLQYSFGTNGAPMVIDGKNVILQGWSAGIGFVIK